MTREELIEQEGEKYAKTLNEEPPSIRVWAAIDFTYALNSQLAKDLQELAVIEGKIEVLKEYRGYSGKIVVQIGLLETQRTELLTKLNLEG